MQFIRGKSPLAEKFARYLIQKNFKVSGIIALGQWKDNQSSKFNLLDLNTQRTYPIDLILFLLMK